MTSDLSQLPQSMHASLALLPSVETPIILLTRHSIREVGKGLGLASHALQLTDEGRILAYSWGKYLAQQTGRNIGLSLSSPIQRCLDTALLMQWGAMGQDFPLDSHTQKVHYQHLAEHIIRHRLLVEPGSFVVNHALASPYFKSLGAVNFIDAFVKKQLHGMKEPVAGVLDILQLLFDIYTGMLHDPDRMINLKVVVSHDTILAAILAVISQEFSMDSQRWPDMMEGLMIWFDQYHDFLQSQLYWVWRGQIYHLAIADLIRQLEY